MHVIHLILGHAMAQACSYHRGPGSIPGQSMWDLWWTEFHWDRFVSKYSGLPLSVSFHQSSILIHSYITDVVETKQFTALINKGQSNPS